MVLNSRRLCQQFIIDAYTMIERERMSYIKNQKKDLRSETYSKLEKLTEKEVAAFKLREIKRFIRAQGLKSEDRPDIITRVFKQKLDSLMKDFKDNHYFRRLKAGPDRVTAAVEDVKVDEIKEYYNCRYLSAYEAAWRIYGFDIHYRFPPVERLPFHLKEEQSVIFNATDSVDYALDKASVNETKFIAWMETNKTDEEARKLLYHEFPTYYVWKQEERIWLKRQKGICIGRVHHVPPSSGELFYLRVLLNKVRGATK
nr:hypothetical protein [Tanacetum cinerariifolium]